MFPSTGTSRDRPVCKIPTREGDQCEKCGTFLNPMELIDPKSKISGRKPTVRQTKHWYFPRRYQARLEEYIREVSARDGWKQNVLQYCRSWFKDGLQDRAVTRDLDWGSTSRPRFREESPLCMVRCRASTFPGQKNGPRRSVSRRSGNSTGRIPRPSTWHSLGRTTWSFTASSSPRC